MSRKIKNASLLGSWKCNADDNRQKVRVESLEGEENVLSIINGSSTWIVASFIKKKKLFPEFIEEIRNFLNASALGKILRKNDKRESRKLVRRR